MVETQVLSEIDADAPLADLAPAVHLDHCVIHVTDWERSNAFYRDVMGAEIIPRGSAFAYRFGGVQLNVHGPGVNATPLARIPVQPGNSDLCFRWSGSIEQAAAHLASLGVTVSRTRGAQRRRRRRGQSLFSRP
jgi:catechol 2,3-dioxygenase-like lactoylglutathione lyase family enzyme